MKTETEMVRETIDMLKSLDFIEKLIKDCEKSWFKKRKTIQDKKKINF